MSVVGPRPGLWNQDVLTAERDKYGANDVKPGLTGWARNVTRLHWNKFLMCFEVVIDRKNFSADKFLLKNIYEIKQIFRLIISKVIDGVRWNWKSIFAVFLFRSSLHHTFYSFNNIVYECEITFAVAVIKDLDRITGTELVGESKVCHIRSSGRSVYSEETESG